MKDNIIIRLLFRLKTIWNENKKYVAGLEELSGKELILGLLLIALGGGMLHEFDFASTILKLERNEIDVIGILFIYVGFVSFLRVVNAWRRCIFCQYMLVLLLFLTELCITALSKLASALFKKARVSHVYTYWTEVILGANWAFVGSFFILLIIQVALEIPAIDEKISSIRGSLNFTIELAFVIFFSIIFSKNVRHYFYKIEKMNKHRADIMVKILLNEMWTIVFMSCLMVIVCVISFCSPEDDVCYQCVNVATVVVLWGTIVDRIHGFKSEHDAPLLSVVIPVYNVSPYLRRCLDSVINQTYTNLEIICVNDGSTDDSLAILEEYAEKDSRIRIISKTNGGLVSARKAGTEAATGEYITQVDSDDYIAEDMYERLMTEAVSHQVDVVTSGLIRDYGSHMVYEAEATSYGYYSDENLQQLLSEIIAIDKFYKPNISLHVTNKIYHTSLYKKYQELVPDEVTVGDDAAVLFPLLYACNSIYVSGSNYYHYCIRSDSIMGSTHVGKDDPLYTMLNHIEKNTLPSNDEDTVLFRKQFDVFSLYMRLLRNPSEVLKYEDGYLYPFGEVSKEETLVLYGAGKFGVALKRFLDENGFENVIWVDQNAKRDGVITWDEAKKMHYDKVIAGALVYDAVESMWKKIGKEESRFLTVHL